MAKILFFGATADAVDNRQIDIKINESLTVLQLVKRLEEDYPRLRGHKLKFAINQEYIDDGESVKESDEIAIFTAVSGG